MATHATLPVSSQHTTLLQFYNNPPTGNITTGNLGSAGTSSMAPSNPVEARQLPRHIIEDQQMCHIITGDARAYLANSSTHPGALSQIHYVTQMFLDISIGDETRNIDMFAQVSAYIRKFVQIADGLGPGVEKIIVEMKSIAAFNFHAGRIQNLARANNGRGTEMIFMGSEIEERSIIFKLGMHMIRRNFSWGLLVAGNEFLVFYLDRRMDGNDTYHHLVLSGRHATIPQPATPGTPGLIQVLTALLLGNTSTIQYTPPRATIGERYLRRTRSETASKKTGKDAGMKAAGSAAKGSGRRRHRTGLETPLETLLGGIQLCTLAYPNSSMPNREIALTHVNAQKAREIINGTVNDLPESDPLAQGAHPISFGAERTGQLLAFEQLGEGICGEVYDSHFIVDGHHAHCAAKVVQYRFDLFWLEVSAYEQMRERQFVPKFYGAFVGMWPTGPLGMILMEKLEKTFNSYEEMNVEEKHGALECLEQLHLAGFSHGDVSSRNFGARNDGEMVILDFSQAGRCGICGPSSTDDTCYEIANLKETLFGNGEEA